MTYLRRKIMNTCRRNIRNVISLIVSIVIIATSIPFNSYAANEVKEYNQFDAGTLAVVNFQPAWGDKEANVNKMVEYINEAYESGVKMILFPEMCVTGYAYSDDPSSEIYQMPIRLAEPVTGPTAKTFAQLAHDYDMWIIYGATETIEGDTMHAYNSAFACAPNGEVVSYQKMTPVEGDWCTPGVTPVILDTEWGPVGLSICYDTYAVPEIERYYTGKGCTLLLNPTATSRSYRDLDGDGTTDSQGWEWYYRNRLESISSREEIVIASANLVGKDGPVDENGESEYNFPGGSVIIGGSFSAPKYYCGFENDHVITGVAGIVSNMYPIEMKTSSITTKIWDFQPDLYAKWYKELADKMADGDDLKYTSQVKEGPIAAVVNCNGIWGDKESNIKMMESYIKEAASKDVDIIVFPETVLTGYVYEDAGSDTLESDMMMQVALAETIPGKTTLYLSEYAKKYDMYIVFGMPELPSDGYIYETSPYLDTTEAVPKVYNSAAILFPDGTIKSYQKIHRGGAGEFNWSVSGNTPVMFDTKWGKVGVNICMDGHYEPELGRYYAANGCTILLHPTATGGKFWYRQNRMSTYTDRDNMAVVTANVLGPDGIYDAETNTYSGGSFDSVSLIITKYIDENGKTSVNPVTGAAVTFNGTGAEAESYKDTETSPYGLEIAKMNLTGTGFKIANFNPLLYAVMYDELALETIDGYISIFGGDSLKKATPVNVLE